MDGVKYIPQNSEDSCGRMIPQPQFMGMETKRKMSKRSKVALILSLVCLAICLAAFVMFFVWLYEVPDEVANQQKLIDELTEEIRWQKKQIEELNNVSFIIQNETLI